MVTDPGEAEAEVLKKTAAAAAKAAPGTQPAPGKADRQRKKEAGRTESAQQVRNFWQRTRRQIDRVVYNSLFSFFLSSF